MTADNGILGGFPFQLNPGYIHTKPVKPVRYGAWYLKPKQWKALKPGEVSWSMMFNYIVLQMFNYGEPKRQPLEGESPSFKSQRPLKTKPG